MIYIFDLDGTLADLTHRLHFIQQEPKDWDSFFAACDKDKVIDEVANVARALRDADNTILIVSGRSDAVREKTRYWLFYHFIPCHGLYMRKAGDHRPDNIAKAEIFEDQVCKDWRRESIAGVFDDRKQVVDMWRSKGLKCFQVAEGDF